MMAPDLQVIPFQPEDAAEAPAFPQVSTPGYDEATVTPGAMTYDIVYDVPTIDPYVQQGYSVPGPDAGAQGVYGVEAYDQPDYEQAAYATDQQAYGQPTHGQPAHGRPSVAGAPKQWIVVLLLAFLLDVLGIHSPYLGHVTKGIIQLTLTITMIGAPIAAIQALIKFIMITARSGLYAYGAQGQPLQ